jgi:Ricin-type beta-trefoil lectin domain-like
MTTTTARIARLGLGVLIAVGGTPAGPAAAADGSFVSAIYSSSANVCVDVPGGTTDVNRNLVPAACASTVEQQFTFTPVHDANNQQPNTYVVVNQASGLCLVKFRFEIRQAKCFGSSPYPAAQTWVLNAVDASAHQYQFVPGYVGTDLGRCMAVGTTSTVLPTPFCDITDPAQAWTLAGMN